MSWKEASIIALAVSLFGALIVGAFFTGLFLSANGWG